MKIRAVFVLFLSICSHFAIAQIHQTIPEINHLEATDRIWVSLVPSDSNKITIEGELADKVEMVISGSSLRLKMKAGYLMKGNQARVVVYSPSVTQLVARKGAELYVEQKELQGDSLNISSYEGAKIRAKIASNAVNVVLATGASVDLLGTCSSVIVNSTAGGSFFGKDLKAESAYVRLNAGGKAEVHATESADVETRAGGVIDVYGKPTNTKHRKIAGGKINFH